MKWDRETQRMKLNAGRVKFALVLTMTLLLPGVTPRGVPRPDETTATTAVSMKSTPETGGLEKEVTSDKYELGDNEVEEGYGKVGLTPLDDSPEFDEAISLGEAAVTASPEVLTMGETREARENNPEEPPKSNNEPEENTYTIDSPIGLDEHDETEENALNLLRLIVKRAIENDDEDDGPQLETIDEDDFAFSDLPSIFAPLIKAFSNAESGAPTPDDFFSWLPALKDLFQPEEEPDASTPTSPPPNTITRARRQSGFPTSPEPYLQIAPASLPEQPAESEVFPSPSLLEDLVIPTQPTVPTPIQTSLSSPSVAPDSEERPY